MNLQLNIMLEEIIKEEEFLMIYINDLLEKDRITLNDNVEINNKQQSLKSILETRYKDNKTASDILKKYQIESVDNMTSKNAYSLFRGMLTDTFYAGDNQNKVKTIIDKFLKSGVPSNKIVEYINSEEFKNDKNNDCYQIIMNQRSSVYTFDEIVNKYLGLDNIKDSLINEIKSKPHANSNINVFKVCQKNPFLKDIKIHDDTFSFEYYLMIMSFDSIVDENLVNEEEINKFVEYFFENKVKKPYPHMADYYFNIIRRKKGWFSTLCGDEDLISVMTRNFGGYYGEDQERKDLVGKRYYISDGDENISIITQALKDKKEFPDLKKYLLNRNKNIIIEYIANNYPKKKHYDVLIKKLPELLEKEAEHGVLDTIISQNNFIQYINSKQMDYFTYHLPVNLLWSSDIKNIIDSVNKIPSINEIEWEYKELFKEFIKVLLNSIKKLESTKNADDINLINNTIQNKVKG